MEFIMHIDSIRWCCRACDDSVTVKCTMMERDMENAVAEIWEQMGDEAFLAMVDRLKT